MGQQGLNALVRRVAPGEHLAVEQQSLTGLPVGHFFFCQGIEVHAGALHVVRRPAHIGPQVQRRGCQVGWAAAVQHKVRMACGSAVGNHGHRFAGCMGGVHLDFDVQHRGQAAQALGANAQCVDLFKELQAHVFERGQHRATARFGLQLVHVQVVHQAFFGHEHRFLRGATNADAEHARRTPARTHGGHRFKHPVNHRVTGVEHDHLALVFRAAAFGRDGDFHRVARNNFGEDDGRCVVFGVFAQELGVCHHAGTQGVGRVVVAATHTFVDGVVQAAGEAAPAHIHADFEEHIDDARVLANRAVADRAHLAVGQNLRNRVFGCRALLAGIGACQMRDVVAGVVVADVLQRSGNRFDQVFLGNGGHGGVALGGSEEAIKERV